MKISEDKKQYRIDYKYELRRKGLHTFPTQKSFTIVWASSKKEALQEFTAMFVPHLLSAKATPVSVG